LRASGGEISASVYHLFNPADQIPLNLILRGTAHYSTFERNDGTAPAFQLPEDHGEFSVRTGLRWGGIEPTLFPALAMELSVWYEGRIPHQIRALWHPWRQLRSLGEANRICFGPRPRCPTRCPRASRIFPCA
jgi:hypothetical protein